ncbi:MAG: O-antigen ligase family protein, partial [Ardenticatenaceae bacterium]
PEGGMRLEGMFHDTQFNRTTLKRSLQRSFVVGSWRSVLVLLLMLVSVAVVGGALVSLVHPLAAVIVPVALGVALLALRTPQWGLYGTILIAILLPFAALPVGVGFKPTFLDLALGLTFFVWFMTLLAGRVTRIRFASFSPLIVAFIVVAFAAFVAGLEHAALDKQTLRRFVELTLGVALFFVVVDHVRRPAQLEGLAAVTMWGGFASALFGIVLYVLPHEIANDLLNHLTIFDYPGGFVLRFILDDPANNQRAISTSVDPNVFGGLLILMTAFAAPQIAARKPLFPRWLAIGMVGTMVLALALTFSRGSMLGLVVALTPLMLLRYRRLIPWALLAVLGLLLLPPAQDYISHFIAGLRGEDLATQMRFGEYKDALRLIRRYPYFGVGFSDAPDIDLYIGVSSVYLLIAEQMGLIGLSIYLLVNLAFFAFAARAILRLRSAPASRAEPLLLGLVSAILGALFAGIFDHHFFDVTFPHFATLYWLLMGMAVAAAQIGMDEPTPRTVEAPPTMNPLPIIMAGAD